MDLCLCTLEMAAGFGLIATGVVGLKKIKPTTWRIPLGLFLVMGVLMIVGSSFGILDVLGIFPSQYLAVGPILAAGSILLVLAFSSLVYFLILTFEDSTFGAVFVPKETFSEIGRTLERMYGAIGAKHILYTLGKDSEYERMLKVASKLHLDRDTLVSRIPSLMKMMGWARDVQILEYVPKESVILRTYDSFESLTSRADGVQSCDFLRGSLAGILKALHKGMDTEGVETHCQSRGDDYCQFALNIFPRQQWLTFEKVNENGDLKSSNIY